MARLTPLLVAAAIGAAGCGTAREAPSFAERVRETCARYGGTPQPLSIATDARYARANRMHRALAKLQPPKQLASRYDQWLHLQRQQIATSQTLKRLFNELNRLHAQGINPIDPVTIDAPARRSTRSARKPVDYDALTRRLGFGHC